MTPLRIGIRLSPPELALEYSYAGQTRFRVFPVDLTSAPASVNAQTLAEQYPHYFSPSIIKPSQLIRLLDSASSSVDLNKFSDSALASVKAAMAVEFQAKQIKPGDKEFQYDRRVEFEEGAEPSDWD